MVTTSGAILRVLPLAFPWETQDPFLFCVHHLDLYPAGNAELGPAASLLGRELGQDFAGKDGWRMYHGGRVPGFPSHPHRGFETVTVVSRGLVDHSDSLGAMARYGQGDVQWLTAGAGIQHSEMFPLLDRGGPNTLELFQIWLNLPAADKLAPPHFAMFWAPAVPRHAETDADGRATEVTVVAGRLARARPPAPPPRSWASREDAHVAIWTLRMAPHARFTLPAAAPGVNRTVYFFRGQGLRLAGQELPAYHGAEVRADLPTTLQAGPDEAELLVLQGRPIGEPVAQVGPFVMNTRQEIQQAFRDYQRTRFGGWPWPSEEPTHPADQGRFARHVDGRTERPGDAGRLGVTVETRLHTCVLCEAVCGLVLEVEDGAIRSVRGDRDDPFSRGHVCPKAAAIPDVVADPDRVRTPLRRVGDRFVPIGWDEALDEAATRLAALQREHGRSSVGLYLGNPTVHSYAALLAAPLLGKLLGTRSRFSATSLDQLPQMLAALEMLGHQLLLPVPDLDRTRFLLVLGANPAVSNGSLLTAPGVADRLRALRARGGWVTVVDPRRTETAALADEHLAIRPGGDAALLAALLQVTLSEGLAREGALPLAGRDVLGEAVAPFTPERVAARTGLEPARMRDLARRFAAAEAAVAYGRVGLCTQRHGGVAAWLLLALDTVTGNLDREGGAMIATPAADLVGLMARLGDRGHFGRYRSRVRGLPEFGGELPAAALAEELETPGDGRLRGLVTFAGNPVLSAPNGRRLDRALGSVEFMVSIDLYVNETTRHANLVLPTSFGPERDHHDLAFYALAARNAARHVEAAVPPPPGVRHDWQVLADLGLRLHARGGGRRKLGPVLALRALRALGPRRVLDLLLRLGPHRLSLAKLRAAPHGLDLGPLEPGRLARALATPDRKVALAPPRLVAGLAEVAADLGPAADGALVLVGRRALRSNNSWLHNSARLVKGPPACTLLMHPADAASRGLADGARVQVRSRAGEVEVPLRVTDEVAPGVVSLPHGWGHGRPGVALRVASAAAGASVNDLTDDALVDPLSGTAALSGVPVEVTAAGGG